METCDVAIVGTGPYGLSAAAHLRQVKGLDIRLFGEPMSFWERHMPEGMLLRSPWEGSHIADPENHLTLDAYRSVDGNHRLAEPVPLKDFIAYGRWFHQQAGIRQLTDPHQVIRIESAPRGFRLTLGDGEALCARRVVVAAGIKPFAYRPGLFAGLPASLVSHTSDRGDLREFRGKEVLVLGGGQSALEAAASLCELGAEVEVLIRGSAVHWLRRHPWAHSKWIAWMFYGMGDIGPAGISLVVQRPSLFRRLPRPIQSRWDALAMRPAGARWLKPRTQGVTIHTERTLVQARVEGERLRVRLNDGTERLVDHVLLGTGYRVNLALYSFLPQELLRRIALANGYPHLNIGFETSLPGLHFLGAPAAWSFGPLMRFVAGTKFTSKALRRRILEDIRPHTVLQPTSSYEFGPLQSRGEAP